jgi:hypothetical protein
LRYDVLPRLIAFGYWHFAWLLYAIKPAGSHRLNADFEAVQRTTASSLVVENARESGTSSIARNTKQTLHGTK